MDHCEQGQTQQRRERPAYDGLVLWGVREVCDRLGLSRSQLYRMIAASDLPPRVRLSAGRWAWVRASIEQFVSDRTQARAQAKK